MLARDLTTTVRGILRDAGDQAAVWGPDVSSPSPTSFFRSFLEGVHANKSQHPPVLQAATYHQYLPIFLLILSPFRFEKHVSGSRYYNEEVKGQPTMALFTEVVRTLPFYSAAFSLAVNVSI